MVVVFWEHLCTQAFFLLPVMFLSYIFLVSLPFPFRFFVALDTHIDRPRGKRAGWSTVLTKTYFVYYLLLFHGSYFVDTDRVRNSRIEEDMCTCIYDRKQGGRHFSSWRRFSSGNHFLVRSHLSSTLRALSFPAGVSSHAGEVHAGGLE
jgi:hypothetical protein